MNKRLIRSASLLLAVASVAGLASADARESAFLANTRQLIFEGKRSGEGYFSADGRTLVFQSEREAGNPFYQIYTLDLASGDTRRVSPGVGKTTCAFIRPGTGEILFASTHLDPQAARKMKAEIDFRQSGQSRRYAWDYDDAMDLFVASPDGGEPKRLTTEPGYDAEGAYSPDGSKIVFSSLRGAFPLDKLSEEDRKRFEIDPASFADLYVMNADGTDVRRLTDSPGYDGGPFFSPDGRRVIWRRFDKTGALADVYTIGIDGTDERRLTEFGSMSWAPYFHPSGDYVVFTSNKHGFSNFELFVVDAQGEREPVRVTFTDGFDGLPVFSPDGTKLSWTSGRTADGKSQIFIADWNDAAAREALRQSPPRKPAASGADPAASGIEPAAATPGISADRLRGHVEFLASDELEGRLTGSPGAQRAAEYLAKHLADIGFRPAAAGGSMFDAFDFSAGVELDAAANRLSIQATQGDPPAERKLEVTRDYLPIAFSENATAGGPLVFAGYGLSMPGAQAEGYDSYAGLDVKGKIAVVLRYVPEDVTSARRQELNRYAGLRYKAMIAREHGAVGLIVVTGPRSPNAGELVALGSDRDGTCGIPVMSIGGDVADALFKSAGRDLKEVQERLDREDPHAEAAFPLNATAEMTAALVRKRSSDRSVVAVLPPESGEGGEYVAIGAHYDHLGHGEVGAMGVAGEAHQIHNGADDNASGTAVVLEIARDFAARRAADPGLRRRGLIVGFWSGEEMGLLGSSHFADRPPVPLDRVVAYVNFDMVGRLRENRLIVQGVGSSGVWPKLIERRNVAAGFSVVTQADPYLPTDSTAFYSRGVPVLNFFTGAHENYHRPTDDTATLDFEGMRRISAFAGAIVGDLVGSPDRPDYLKVERSAGGGGRDVMRVSIGSIPDYATEVEGVKLAGVRAGSPAEKGGLKGGDVIVEFGGQKIKNIYDYTYALDAARVGEPVEVAVLRDGERVVLKVTPEGRK